VQDVEQFFKDCDLKAVVFKNLADALGVSPFVCRTNLDARGVTFIRLKQGEVRRRIVAAVDAGNRDTADIIATVGVSQGTFYRHFSYLYKTTPTKYLAKHRGEQYAVA
jgi:methylphosphotriester-DNA--protein-cysteine methyltransferase